jgi:hypothetical protein
MIYLGTYLARPEKKALKTLKHPLLGAHVREGKPH